MRTITLIVASLFLLAATFTYADPKTEKEITQLIIETNADVREMLKADGDTVSKEGSLEFWSSGGLLQAVAADSPTVEYDAFTIVPKHIQVITLVPGQSAVAHYYAEGTMQAKGGKAVTNYRTRATEVYVKESGKWKIRAAHWSPIAGGGGTNQTSVDD